MRPLNAFSFLTGLLMGSTVGAIAGLLYAPGQGYALGAIRNRRALSKQDPLVDEAIDESFPASDPPSWTASTSRVGS